MFILPNLHTGGAERIITTISNHLSREKFIPSILLFQKEGGYLDFLKEDIEIIEIKTSSIRSSLFPILKTIWKRKPDIVFSGWGEISAFLSPFIPLFKGIQFISRETNVVSQHVTRKEIRFFYRFYNQNGSKLKVDYFNQSGRTYAANSVDAVISREGNKFTIFFLNKERDLVALSGEFTGDAIKDFQQSVINKVEEPIGTVRVFKSKSGYAESTREF